MTESILNGISQDWLNIIYSGETKKHLDHIYNILKSVKNITPDKEDLFNWARLTKLENIRVVIIGQDPYSKQGWAHGLSFSCLGNIIPPSLKNIYKALINTECIPTIPDHGDLTSWAKQGVLLLNASLSTIIETAGSHMKIWVKYINLVIIGICKYHYDNNNQLIFLLWGSFAQEFVEIIDDDYHICLNAVHPSPLAQNVSKERKFINCNHFKWVNKFLKEEGGVPINWMPQKIKNTIKNSDNKPVFEKKPVFENEQKNEQKNDKKNTMYDDAESILGMSSTKHIIFTDGSCFPNNKSKLSRGGYATVFVSGPFKDTCLYGNLDICVENASNIRAEGVAIIRGLELVRDCLLPWNKCDIISDCKFWIDMIDIYMPKWNKAKFNEKSNPDLTLRMWLVYNEVKEKGEIKFIHMKSHGKDGWQNCVDGSFEKFCFEQNKYADEMCGYARVNMQPTNELIEKMKY
jgi:uracil-DNA glycosylase